ncbi:uncharacterized protein LOC135837479 [Planococcus citri]|uniref:uncharacterized protein LOC135837479 n=1 Tax=Planococcus citri TaxID=170843 RepID=UPI0031F77920
MQLENQENDEITPSKEDDSKENAIQDHYIIDPELLKLLQRELDLETVDNESDPQKRMVYEEVYAKSITNRRSSAVTDEIKSLRRELRLNSLITNTESLFTLPRTFTRRSARFELPMSKSSLSELTSLDYLKLHVYITNKSHLIYNEVFKIHIDPELNETRLLPSSKIITALEQVMGRSFTQIEQQEVSELIDLKEKSHVDFRTWCGICAMCERLLAVNFAQKYLSTEEDPCHEVELVDFSLLDKRLKNINVDPRLDKMLRKIRDT